MKVVQLALDKHILIIKNIDNESPEFTTKLNKLITLVTEQCRNAKD